MGARAVTRGTDVPWKIREFSLRKGGEPRTLAELEIRTDVENEFLFFSPSLLYAVISRHFDRPTDICYFG